MDAVGIPCTPAEIASPPRGVGTRTFPLSETETNVATALDYNLEMRMYIYGKVALKGLERIGEYAR